MQLPIKAHYATLALLAMASRFPSGEPLQARVIAKKHKIPSQFLGQILQQLRTAGLINSTRGSSGGFRLARAPEEISIATIVEAVCNNGAVEFHESVDDPFAQIVSGVWRELKELQMEFLERLTLTDLSQRLTLDPAGMFFI